MNIEVIERKLNLQLFQKEEFGSIRTVILNGNPWFVAADVCKILGICNPTDALNKGLENFEKARLNLGLQGGDTNIISESGFYTLVLRSRKPIAKPFRIWVTNEVLPAIRKTGEYTTSESKMESMLEDMDCKMEFTSAQINDVREILSEQNVILNQVVDNMTLTTRQQQRIYKAAKDRINHLLGGAHSREYKSNSKSYFINLWNGLKSKFGCGGSYKDLNPIYFEDAMKFISSWEYIEL